MKNYPYAHIYLRLLLVVAFLVVLSGVLGAVKYGIAILGDVDNYGQVKSRPVLVDLKRLADDINAATGVVRTFTNRKTQFAFEVKLASLNFKRAADSKAFSGAEIERLERSLAAAREGSDDLKAELLDPFLTALDQVRNATSSATAVEAGAKAADKLQGLIALIKNEADEYHRSVPAPHLYTEQAIAAIPLEELIAVGSYLSNDIRTYSPSRNGPSQQYEARLAICASRTKMSVTSGWIIDGQEFKDAENAISEFRTRQKEELALLRSKMFDETIFAIVSVFCAMIIALAVLIVRDFFSAIIDIAMNTRDTTETLEKIRRAETPV